MSLLLQISIQWAGLLLLWLLFVFQVTKSELLVGAAASAATVLALQAALRAVPPCFESRLRWLAQAWRLPGMIAQDSWILLEDLACRVLHKPARSAFEIWKFHAAGGSCRTSAQRALAILLVSMSPNSIVLDIDVKSGRMFMHKLEPAPIPDLVRKLQE